MSNRRPAGEWEFKFRLGGAEFVVTVRATTGRGRWPTHDEELFTKLWAEGHKLLTIAYLMSLSGGVRPTESALTRMRKRLKLPQRRPRKSKSQEAVGL